MKKNYILLAILTFFICKVQAQPGTPAPKPTANASNVVSLWGNTYTNVPGTNWYPNWGQATQVAYSSVGGDTTLGYTALNYEGVAFANPIDLSNMDSLHLDVWSPNTSSLDVRLINSTAVQNTGNPIQPNVTLTLNNSGWNVVSIPISKFTGLKLNVLDQMSFTALTPSSGGTIYLEHIYFVSHVNLPTITGFSIPSNLLLGAAPFTLTDPASNSTGAFTYTSSDVTVATISGKVVTIVGAGSTVITANQAAAGSFSKGSASATLVVSYPPPTTAATAPTQSATNVISLWGNNYANVDGINWYPNWGQATQLGLSNIGGDTTLEYSNLNYEGVQTTTPLNVGKASYFHLDVWTPNATAVVVNLINSALVTGGAAVQVADTISLTTSGWNAIDIPVTAFKGVDLTKVDQVMFVGATPATSSVIYLQNIYFWASVPLAVSLADFKASKIGNTASLTWKTVSETNNKGFNVQRSSNGKNWATLKYVAGAGTGSSYSFVDNSPASGVSYYRLGLVDASGKVTYSSTLSVDFSKATVGISFYPNPVKSVMNVSIPAIQSNTASLSLVGLNGRTIKTVQLGTQSSNSNVAVNVAGLAKGIYVLTLKDGATVKTAKVVVE